MRKIVVRIHDAPFTKKENETFHEITQRLMAEIILGLQEKGEIFDGIFVSLPKQIVYAWKRM